MENLPIRTVALVITMITSTASLAGQTSPAQASLLFYQLNTSHGLSDNYINDMAIDSSGNLWIASGDGLNMFNGKTVLNFFHQEYPQITHDFIKQVVCDDANRIWALSYDRNVAIVDEERQFLQLALWEDGHKVPVRRILYPSDAEIILFAVGGFYQLKGNTAFVGLDSITSRHFIRLDIAGFDTLHQIGYRQVEKFDDKRYLLTTPQRFYLVNFFTREVERVFEMPEIFVLRQWDEDVLLAQDRSNGQLLAIDMVTGDYTMPFASARDQHGKAITDDITNAYEVQPDQFLLTSRSQGLYLFNRQTGYLINQKHNPADPNTIGNNSPFIIAAEENGWVFLGVTPNGVSYYKSDAVIGQQSVFMDALGHSYDGHVNAVTTLDNDVYWLGTYEYLIKWTRSTNQSEFVRYDGRDIEDASGPPVLYVAFDPLKRLWVSSRLSGIYILDKDRRLIRHLYSPPESSDVLPSNNVRYMVPGADGYMWCATDRGVCRVDLATFAVDQFAGKSLEGLRGTYTDHIWFEDPDHVWVSSFDKGAWRYTLSSGEVETVTMEDGLLTNEVFCFNKDRYGNLYVGTEQGLCVFLQDGSVRTYTVEDGLLNRRVEAMLRDDHDRMWMGNDVGLACFDIADTTLKVFDERYGLSVYGFRLASYHQNTTGELVWGTERGLQYFYPDRLLDQRVAFPTTINRIETRDFVRDLTRSTHIRLSPANNYITFHFTSIDYSKHLRTFYQYQLEGLDKEWLKVKNQTTVRYSGIPAGDYTFRVKASNDDRTWEDAGNAVSLTVAKPVWKRFWFRALLVLGIAGLGWLMVRNERRKRLLQQEELETQVVINYFASRINSYRQIDELLWDVAENCISKLHFEDCVIYLLDSTRNVMVQKAAFGPKMDKVSHNGGFDFAVHEPIEIPVGKGIVGAVAVTGESQMVPDTTLDDRYIVDDVRRYSEMAVPMKTDGTVIGVIDSEHSRKHFFTQKHLNILSTIAALCANQIQRVLAEDEKQQAMIEVLENKQKVTESRLQSLRLQMNPHFLFNALNSIQQMILANEEMVATRYLSRFSKLLRAILVHSDKELVTLKEELEILNLYIDLESVRFKEAFRYQIDCPEDIDIDEVKIPTLLIQPFVENAIWHGLMHKEGDRLLSIDFRESDDWLYCSVRDNGVGRDKSRELRISTGKNHTSKGISVSLERVRTMRGSNGRTGDIEILDLRDGEGNPQGTQVNIQLPLQG